MTIIATAAGAEHHLFLDIFLMNEAAFHPYQLDFTDTGIDNQPGSLVDIQRQLQ